MQHDDHFTWSMNLQVCSPTFFFACNNLSKRELGFERSMGIEIESFDRLRRAWSAGTVQGLHGDILSVQFPWIHWVASRSICENRPSFEQGWQESYQIRYRITKAFTGVNALLWCECLAEAVTAAEPANLSIFKVAHVYKLKTYHESLYNVKPQLYDSRILWNVSSILSSRV